MILQEALDVFGVNDLSKLNQDDIKKTYRVLMKKCHPDLTHDDGEEAKKVNEAYEMLTNILPEIAFIRAMEEDKSCKTFIIPFSGLLELYSGKEVELMDNDERVKFVKKDVYKHNFYMALPIRVVINNSEISFNKFVKWQYNGDYSTDILIKDESNEESAQITVQVEDKQSKLEIKTGCTLNYKFDCGIKLKIRVDRRRIEKKQS